MHLRCVVLAADVLTPLTLTLTQNIGSSQMDLVPKEVVANWLKHLRRSFPAIVFKASTQENTSSIKQTKVQAMYLKYLGFPLILPSAFFSAFLEQFRVDVGSACRPSRHGTWRGLADI